MSPSVRMRMTLWLSRYHRYDALLEQLSMVTLDPSATLVPSRRAADIVGHILKIKKKLREDTRYSILYGESPSHGRPAARDESDDESSPRRTNKKPSILNKIFKKAKNSDDEDESNCVYEIADMSEIADAQPQESDEASPPETMSVFNRKKKCYLDLSGDKKTGSRKHPGWVKFRPAPGIPARKTVNESNEHILKEFDPLWTEGAKGEVKSRRVHNYEENDDLKTMPIKPPRNKINNKIPQEDNSAEIQSELKVAKVDFIQESEVPVKELAAQLMPNKDLKSDHLLVNANVCYENMERALFTPPVISDNSEYVGATGIRVILKSFGKKCNLVSVNKAVTSNEPNVCSSCKAPKKQNVSPSDVQEAKEEASATSVEQLDNEINAETSEPKEASENKDPEEKQEAKEEASATSVEQLDNDINAETSEPKEASEDKDTEEKQRLENEWRANQFIAQFFSERARSFNDDDIANYSKDIQINKIEIYAEDLKRYYEGLKYRRGPIEHDTIYITVGTALDFVQKLVKERENKKKYRFIPDMLEKCFKSKAKREAEEKKKEEEKKQKDSLRPKVWLVYNRVSKEKIIICTPGEFYDSE